MKQLLSICLLLAGTAAAQPGTHVQLRFVPKKGSFKPAARDYQPGKNGFYLYENCIYTLLLDDDRQYNARILRIKKDSIVFASHFNAAVAQREYSRYDTITTVPERITAIRLIGDRIMGLFSHVPLRRYRPEFVTDSFDRRLYIDTVQVYEGQPQQYELVPYLTVQGLDRLYEKDGRTYYYQGIIRPDTAVKIVRAADTVFRKRNIAWVLPSGANQVNGWALGVHTGQLKGRRLTINGLNTSADIPAMFISMMSLPSLFSRVPVGSLGGSTDTNWYITRINGLSLSMGGLLQCSRMHGMAVSGGMCAAMYARGIIITGGFNTVEDFKGLSICGLRNVSAKGRGIQIALFNICKDFKGIQLGLWNVNGRRKLPLINWGV